MNDRRRLPLFMLVDCSASMSGAPLEALNEAIDRLAADAAQDALARESVHIGVIAFGGTDARLITNGLQPVDQFTTPTLVPGGDQRPLGAALHVLDEAINEYVVPTCAGQHLGDWRPLAFILLGGMPTDDWQESRDRLLARRDRRLVHMVVIGFGRDVDDETLAAIGTPAMAIADVSASPFRHLFAWVSSELSSVMDESLPPSDWPSAQSVPSALSSQRTGPLPTGMVEVLQATLNHVAELVAEDIDLNDEDLSVLVLAVGLEAQKSEATAELRRWVDLLSRARQTTTPAARAIAKRALMVRGVAEGPARLAVDVAAAAVTPPLSAIPTTVSMGELALGTGGTAELTVCGGPGTVVCPSSDLSVEPTTFGHGETVLRIQAAPATTERLLWETITLESTTERLLIEVTARWTAAVSEATLVVSPTEPGGHRTISSALTAATPGDTIQVRPGHYQEALILDTPITLVGDGPREDIIIESSSAPCITMQTDSAIVEGLTLRRSSPSLSGVAGGPCIDTPEGRITVNRCDVTSGSASSIWIHGLHAYAMVNECQIHDARINGIYANANGQGVIDGCEIFGNTEAGIVIENGSNPVVRSCRIHDNKVGVRISEHGRGTIVDCDIFASTTVAGVTIQSGGDPVVRGSRIHNNQGAGTYVFDNGRGTIDNCDIYANANAGVIVRSGGNPIVRGCRIHDGKEGGVYVREKGRGTIEGGEIFANATSGIAVTADGDPTVRGCRIRGHRVAISVGEQAHGVFEDITFEANDESFQIHPGGDPIVRSRSYYVLKEEIE
ncbi:right-handed parallel beta-helix repeat-containing protein [Nonomuraea polychroma]|uniref:right-handed parallel beta-helix repeat-containing protein n=1 Tax=Nonomuraea polychroma TaxID=46176 RepID=UPI003D8C218A